MKGGVKINERRKLVVRLGVLPRPTLVSPRLRPLRTSAPTTIFRQDK